MTRSRRDQAAIMRQRAGKVRGTFSTATELQAPIGTGGSAPRKATSTSPTRSPNASSRRWRQTRAAKLKAQPECELKLPGCEGAAVEVDHIKQLAAGGARFDWANLRSVCGACHDRRHGKRKRRPRIKGCDAEGYPLDPDHPWSQEK